MSEKKDSIEKIALNFMLDSLFKKQGVLYANDSLYFQMGLKPEIDQLMNSSNIVINNCDNLLTRPLFFSDDPDIENDSIRRLSQEFEVDLKKASKEKRVINYPDGFAKAYLSKSDSLKEGVLFVTLRNPIRSTHLFQIEINLCKKSNDGMQYSIHFFIDDQRQIIYWDFLQEVSFPDEKECLTCYP